MAEALAARLEAGDPSYYVEAACVRALAKAHPKPESLLLAALDRPSHNDVIRQAALDSLRSLDAPRHVKTFAGYTKPAFSLRTRQTAARALAVAALPGAPEEEVERALEALRPLLRSRARRLRRAALAALAPMGKAARPLLDEVERMANQDANDRVRAHAKRVLGSLRRDAPPNEQLRRLEEARRKAEESQRSLEKRVKALEKQLKALEAKQKAAKKEPPKQAPKQRPARKKRAAKSRKRVLSGS